VSDEPPQYVDYPAWGAAFFRTVVTTERVLAGVGVLSGRPVDVGPLGVGPGRLVKVRATGRIGQATGVRTGEDPATFSVALPVALDFVLDLGVDKHRYTADITVPLALTARARHDLAIVLDVAPPRASQLHLRLRARGLRASVTKHAGGVEGELRRFVAKYVADQLDEPYVLAARVIDVAGLVDGALGAVPAVTSGA
jgi:hypothetical protein